MAITNNLNNSSLRKYLPAKVIGGFAQSMANLESWLYNDNDGDPWWQGASGVPCKWILTADVYTATHSCHMTRVPYQYAGLDIVPGMWVFAASEAKALRISTILSKTDSSIECIVEDVDRYNTFADPTASGAGGFSSSSNLIFFELAVDGLPVLNPLPANTDIAVISQIEARFRVFNPSNENRFYQINHNFKEGQVLKLDKNTGLFVQATSTDLYIVGTVSAVGPGPNYFYLSPSTKVMFDLEPGLPGVAGDIIWIDPVTGDRATEPNGSSAPLYIKLSNSIPSYTVSSVVNPVAFAGSTIKLNNEVLEFQNNTNTPGIITVINQTSQKHGVTAMMGSASLFVDGSVAYPSTTPATGRLEFRLNGVTTIIDGASINFGTSGQFGWWDVVRAINEQEFKHHVYAMFDTNTGTIKLENDQGGNINFINDMPAFTTDDNKTLTDMIGVVPMNPAHVADRLKFVRGDGGSIIISDVMGSFTTDTGLESVDNGALPIALVVDKTMAENENYVVADIAARDDLMDLRVGDQVYVQDWNGYGEWALYLKTSTDWTKLSDFDSASTDAKTFTHIIDAESTFPIIFGRISPGSRVVNVAMAVSGAFDNNALSFTVGTLSNPSAIATEANFDMPTVGSYETTSTFVNEEEHEIEIYAYLTGGPFTVGNAKIIISYL